MSRGLGDFARGLFRRSLKAQLEMIKSRVYQSGKFRFVERQAAGDQADVEAGDTGGVNEFDDVRAGQRFAAGEIDLQNPGSGRLLKNTGPGLRGEFGFALGHFKRIPAVEV